MFQNVDQAIGHFAILHAVKIGRGFPERREIIETM